MLEVEEGEVEWVVLVETELEADVVVGCDDDEGKDDELWPVDDDDVPESAKYAAAPATAIITTTATANTAVAMPLDDERK